MILLNIPCHWIIRSNRDEPLTSLGISILTLESDRLYVHAIVAQPSVSVLYAKSFEERNTDLSDADRRLGFLREFDLALYLDTFRLTGTQVGHFATVVPRRQFAGLERVVQLYFTLT